MKFQIVFGIVQHITSCLKMCVILHIFNAFPDQAGIAQIFTFINYKEGLQKDTNTTH